MQNLGDKKLAILFLTRPRRIEYEFDSIELYKKDRRLYRGIVFSYLDFEEVIKRAITLDCPEFLTIDKRKLIKHTSLNAYVATVPDIDDKILMKEGCGSSHYTIYDVKSETKWVPFE